jgi:hypothetical protein
MFGLAVISLLIFLGQIQQASAGENKQCSIISDWLTISGKINQAIKSQSPDLAGLRAQEWNIRTQTVKLIARKYFNNEFSFVNFHICFNNAPERGNFYQSVNAELVEFGISILKQSRLPLVKKLIKLYQAKYTDNETPLTRMTGHTPRDQSPTGLKAGFHRNSGSIFYDISLMTPNEWLFIFIHELLHSLDITQSAGTHLFYDPDVINQVSLLSLTYVDSKYMSPRERAKVNEWLYSGLSRGLWAEYRAWVVSFAIYIEGRDGGLWQPIDWMENILNERPTKNSDQKTQLNSKSLKHFVYSYLDDRSEDPIIDIFQTEQLSAILNLLQQPLIRQMLNEIRKTSRQGRLPDLGNLAVFFK